MGKIQTTLFCTITFLFLALANGFIVKPSNDHSTGHSRFTFNHNDYLTSHSSFAPNGLKVDEKVFENLMEELSGEVGKHYSVKARGYFPNGIDDDEEDQLAYLEAYDENSESDDKEDIKKIFEKLSSASITAEFGKCEFGFSRILSIHKNGTKDFAKFRQATKVNGNANTKLNGNATILAVGTSASAQFESNVTYSSRSGPGFTSVVTGESTVSGASRSKLEKRRYLSESGFDTSTKFQISSTKQQFNVNSSVQSGSETFSLPFRSYFTLFSSKISSTADSGAGTEGNLAGEVTSHVAFASKNASLTKSYVKAFLKTSSSVERNSDDEFDNNDNDNSEQDDDSEDGGFGQVVLIKAKSHTFTKVVSKSESQIVLDVITSTKTRAYGKSWQKGKFVVLTGTGQIAFEKSQLTISHEEFEKMGAEGFGLQFIHKQVESNSVLGSSSLGRLMG